MASNQESQLPSSFTIDDVKNLRHWRPKSSSFRMRLAVAMTVMVFVVAAVEGLVLGQSIVAAQQQRIGQSLQADATRIADQLNKTMAARANELIMLGTLDPLRNLANPSDQVAILDQLRRTVTDYNWLGIAQNGKLVVQSGVRLDGDDSTAPVTENGGVMVLKHPVPGQDGTPSSTIVAELGWSWIRDIQANSLTPDDDGEVTRQFYLISANNLVMAGPTGTVGTTLDLPVIDRARAGATSWSTETWPDGIYLTGAAFAAGEGQNPGPGSQTMNWTVLVRQNVSKSLDAVGNLRLAVLAVALVLALVFMPVGWMFAGQLTGPLRQIVNYADRLSQGDDVELPQLHNVAEIETLSQSLRAMVATLTHKENERAEMESRATHDPLTGLFNREGLQRWLHYAMQRGRADESSILLLVGDLDGFKAVNDKLGHGAGDQLLRQVASRLSEHLRPTDAVARFGGDEFVIAVASQRGDGGVAATIAERALASVIRPYDLSGNEVDVGITLGAAMWPDENPDVARVLQMADRALYAGKRAGKRRIMFYRNMKNANI